MSFDTFDEHFNGKFMSNHDVKAVGCFAVLLKKKAF